MSASSEIFLNSFGSAIGGFIGVIIFFSIRLFIEYMFKRKSHVKTYYIANEINYGQKNENQGMIMHHSGKVISDENEYKRIGYNYKVWEWTRDKTGDEGDSIFYGPFSTDLNEPGKYEIDFYIKCIGFSKPDEIIDDPIILKIDVNEIFNRTEQRLARSQFLDGLPQMVTYPEMNIIGLKYISVSDISNSINNKFSIIVTSTGKGIWEFRSFAYDGTNDRADNLSRYENTTRIIFDKIVINKLKDMKLPWE